MSRGQSAGVEAQLEEWCSGGTLGDDVDVLLPPLAGEPCDPRTRMKVRYFLREEEVHENTGFQVRD